MEDALGLVLAALSLLGLGIFGPAIATGLTAGAPQLGAGAAVGAALTAGGLGVAGVMGLRAGAAALGGTARPLPPAGSSPPLPPASPASALASASGGPPAWAREMRRNQAISHGALAAVHAVRSGDHRGAPTSVDLKDSR
jgi:type IV secretion system protein TrbL